jgi:tetratricopeptide (TPR) repeat protein
VCPTHGAAALLGRSSAGDEAEVGVAPEIPSFPGFRRAELIGRGGFGEVFRAVRDDGAIAAIKVARADRPEAWARLAREIEILRRVGPPHVPAVHGSGRLAGGRPFVIMEHVDGPNLAARLLSGAAPIAPAQACAVGAAVARAVAAVHAAGYVHRDLKPENAFVSPRAQATLVDFGLCSPAEGASEGGPSWAPGTAEYMAPELFEERGRVDLRADLYALGVILCELATGRPPFWGPRAVVQEAHRARRPPRLSALAGEGAPVLTALEDIVARCLAKDPGDRFPDALALAAALDASAASASLSFGPAEGGAAPARARDRLTVGLLFFAAEAEVTAVRARVRALGGELAHGGGGRYVAVFGHDHPENPARRAVAAGEELIEDGVTARARLDVATVAVQQRRDGSLRFVSPRFTRADQYPADDDARGLSFAPAAAEVLRPSDTAAPDESSETAALPLLGRDDLVASLLAAADAARAGRPGAARVTAPPGYGKSHLARALARLLGQRGHEVLHVEAREPALGEVDHALVELLRAALDLPATPPEEGAAALLASRLHPADGDRVPLLALALGWLGVRDDGGELVRALAPLRAAPGALQAGVTLAAGSALRLRAEARPLCVILDDAHHAGDALLAALEHATLAERGVSLWICALGRPAFAADHPDFGARAAHREEHTLGPLDPESAARLCRRLLLPVQSIPDSSIALLVDRAQAVPLLLVELVRGLRRRGIIRKSPKGGAHYLATDELDQLPDLPLIEWLARGELLELAPALQDHARLVALLGREVPVEEIEGVIARLGLPPQGGPADRSLDARIGTQRLRAAGVLVDAGRGGVAFRHDLVREAIAHATPAEERLRIHRAAAAYHAEVERGADRSLGRLAHHAAEAGLAEVAERAYLALAESARARHAYTEAERLYSRALAQPGGARAGALRGRGLMRYRIGRYHDALADLSAARALVAEAGDVEAEVEILLDEATALDWMDERERSEERVLEARARAAARCSPHLDARVLLGLGRSAYRHSRNEESVELLGRAASVAEALGEEAYETLVIALLLLGGILPALGHIDDALRALSKATALCAAHGDRLHLAAALNNRAICWGGLGRSDQVTADLGGLLAIARELGLDALEFSGEINLGEILLLMDHVAAAAPHIARALTLDRRLSGDALRPMTLLLQARLHLRREELAEAAAIAVDLRRREVAEREAGRTLLVPVEEIVCSLVELATSGAGEDAWAALEVHAEEAGFGPERIEAIEARALAAARRGLFAEAKEHLIRAVALGEIIPCPMSLRVAKRLTEF